MQNQFVVHIKVTQHNKLTILQLKKRILRILNMLAQPEMPTGVKRSTTDIRVSLRPVFPRGGRRVRVKKEGRVSGELTQ